jgi:hypothetical protein
LLRRLLLRPALLSALLILRPLLILSVPFGRLRLTLVLAVAVLSLARLLRPCCCLSLALLLGLLTFATAIRLSLACVTLRRCGVALLLLPRLDALGFMLLVQLLRLPLCMTLVAATFHGLEPGRFGLLTPAFLILLELALFVEGMLTAFFLALAVALLLPLSLELLAFFLCRLLRLFVAGHASSDLAGDLCHEGMRRRVERSEQLGRLARLPNDVMEPLGSTIDKLLFQAIPGRLRQVIDGVPTFGSEPPGWKGSAAEPAAEEVVLVAAQPLIVEQLLSGRDFDGVVEIRHRVDAEGRRHAEERSGRRRAEEVQWADLGTG